MGAKQPGGGKWPRADRLLSGTQSGEADVLLLRVARFLRQCGATLFLNMKTSVPRTAP